MCGSKVRKFLGLHEKILLWECMVKYKSLKEKSVLENNKQIRAKYD